MVFFSCLRLAFVAFEWRLSGRYIILFLKYFVVRCPYRPEVSVYYYFFVMDYSGQLDALNQSALFSWRLSQYLPGVGTQLGLDKCVNVAHH